MRALLTCRRQVHPCRNASELATSRGKKIIKCVATGEMQRGNVAMALTASHSRRRVPGAGEEGSRRRDLDAGSTATPTAAARREGETKGRYKNGAKDARNVSPVCKHGWPPSWNAFPSRWAGTLRYLQLRRLLLAATQLTAFSSAVHQEEKSRSISSGLLCEPL